MSNNQDSVLGDYVAQLEKQREERDRKRREEEEHQAAKAKRLRMEEEESLRAERLKKKIKWFFIVLGIVFAVLSVALLVQKKKEKEQKATEEIAYNYANKSYDSVVNNIQSILTSLSTNCSKSGNPNKLSSLFAETVSPYVTKGNTQLSRDIPERMRKFLGKYDCYEMSSPTELNVQPNGNSWIATYSVIVEWNSERTGHKRACIQKTIYFNSEYKITGFTDEELWRESVADNSYLDVLSDRNRE